MMGRCRCGKPFEGRPREPALHDLATRDRRRVGVDRGTLRGRRCVSLRLGICSCAVTTELEEGVGWVHLSARGNGPAGARFSARLFCRTPHSAAEVRASRAPGPLECEVGQASATIRVDGAIRMALRNLLNHPVGPEKQ
jgi:hypothetical protein